MKGLLRLFASAQSAAPPSPAADDPVTPERLQARAEFQDLKFGLFVHWGVYSILGHAEWVMNDRQIHIEDYEKLPDFFNPIDYDPAEWVALAKRTGMKYLTVTTKHHDGFAMFHSKVSDWNVVDRTPYKRDVLRMLVDACNEAGIKIIFYHSHLDWRHPDYFPRGRTGHDLGRPESGDWYPYLDYMDAQITELCTNYGEIGGFWFDGFWDRLDADWRLERTYNIIHSLQPKALIGNNHHVDPFPGEDYQMWERDLPGNNASGYNEGTKVGRLPLETCDTLCGSWGFNITDRAYKTPRQLVEYLVRAAGNNANFLLNIGPMPNGKIQPEFVERLEAVGRWMDVNAESIHGTRGGPGGPQPWGAVTHSDEKVYIHLLEPEKVAASTADDGIQPREDPEGTGDTVVRLHVPLFNTIVKATNGRASAHLPKATAATLLRDGQPVEFEPESDGLGVRLSIPLHRLDEYDTVIALSFAE